MPRTPIALGLLAGLALVWTTAATAASAQDQTRSYEVTITNLTANQIFSPPLLATHNPSMRVFEVGQPAAEEIRPVAEGGNTGPLADRLLPIASDVQRTAQPVLPGASMTVQISAQDGDALSLVCMLAQTNDGFVGLDALPLPAQAVTIQAGSYDAGTEQNTERAADVPGPPFGGMAHPATVPARPIAPHPGITGVGDIGAEFNWQDPVARLEVSLLATQPDRIDRADLTTAIVALSAGLVAAFIR